MPDLPDLPDLRSLDWKNLHPLLLLATEGRLRRMSWFGERHGQTPGGRAAHDFVHTAYVKFAEGQRTWNYSISAFDNFYGSISSEISNLATSSENKITTRIDDNVIKIIRDGRPNPEEKALYNLEVEKLLEYISGDARAREMAHRILIDEITTMKELSVAMSIDQLGADTIKKCLKNWVVRYTKEHPTSAFVRNPTRIRSQSNEMSQGVEGASTNDQ